MFYRTDTNDHGLPHNPLKALISPRPIGWVSSYDAQGRANLAPYSFFQAVNDAPPMLIYSTTGKKIGRDEEKDSLLNIRDTGAFCVNIVSHALTDAMNISAGHYARGDNEFARAGLTAAKAETVNAPFVAEAPASFECELDQIIDLGGTADMVIGRITGVHIDEAILKDGLVDVTAYQPLARLGYRDYAVVREVFQLKRPGE